MATVNAGFGSISDVASGGIAHVFDTATSYSAGKLGSWQTGGSEVAYVDHTGSHFLPDGTAASPSLSYTGDNDSGLFRIGDDNLGLALGGSKVVDYAASGVTVTGDLTVTGSINASSSGVVWEDDEQALFGTDTDYWFVYDATATQFELNATDVDGGGTDGIVFSVADGSDVVAFTSTPTAGGTNVVLETRTLTSGGGLTGGGDLSTDRTLAVGAGTGIAVNADDVALSHLGIESLVDPNADRILFWDDSAGAAEWLTAGTGLSLTTTTLAVTLSPFDTGDLSEGGNLYFTDERVDDRVAVLIQDAASGGLTWTYSDAGGTLTPSLAVADADVAAGAEIAVSKLADGTARQLLQTDAAGTGVEWASNIDIPGTLDVTSAATFDSTVDGVGAATLDTGANGSSFGGDLTVSGDFIVSGTGPQAIGGITQDFRFLNILTGNTFTSGGGATVANIVALTGTLQGANGDTNRLVAFEVNPNVTTQGNSETISEVATFQVRTPGLTVEAGDTVTNATTLHVKSQPSAGTNRRAFWVELGLTELGGDFQHSGTNLGLYSATPVAQPTTGGTSEAAFVENAGGTAVNVDSTFGGYTLQQIAQALQDIGALA